MNVKKIISTAAVQHCWCCPWPPAAQQGNGDMTEVRRSEPKNAQEAAAMYKDPDGCRRMPF